MSSLSLIFIWLDKRIGNLPGGNQKLKEKFRNILSPIRQFDRPRSCLDFIEQSSNDKRILFLTSSVFADKLFLNKIASLSNIYRIYVYDQEGNNYQINDANLTKKMGSKRVIRFDEQLYEQITLDLIDIYSNESNRLQKGDEAKKLLESAIKLIELLDEKDENFEQIEQDLISRLQRLK